MTSRPHRILVIGASGMVGGALTKQLSDKGIEVRAATRDPHTTLPNGAQRVTVDLAHPHTLDDALDGVDAVHLIWPFFEPGEETRRKVAPIARLLGERVRRVVYVSALGAADDPNSFWHVVEDAISHEVPEWTILRPTGFAANARQWQSQLRHGDVVRWPFGELARPLIHERDIAAVSAVALTEGGHHGQRYVITGPSHLTQREQVAEIGSATGRSLRWEELDPQRAHAEFGMPEFMLDAWDEMRHTPEPVTDVVQQLTGQPARTFADWARDHAADFTTTTRQEAS